MWVINVKPYNFASQVSVDDKFLVGYNDFHISASNRRKAKTVRN